ncbi:hypothetical protein HDU92_005123, partial [Lobulomyces angularis]
MIDSCTILANGGKVLFEYKSGLNVPDLINDFVEFTLTNQSTNAKNSQINLKNNVLMYRQNNKFNYTIILSHQNIISIPYSNSLLAEFDRIVEVNIENLNQSILSSTFLNLVRKFEDTDLESKRNKAPRSFKETDKYLKSQLVSKESEEKRVMKGYTPKSKSDAEKSPKTAKKSTKQARTWSGDNMKDNNKSIKALDYSKDSTVDRNDEAIDANSLIDQNGIGKFNSEGLYEASELETPLMNSEESESSGFLSYFQNLTSQRVLKEEDLAPVLETLRNHLIDRNVAVDITGVLSESILKALVGKKIGTFSRVHTIVSTQMEQSIKKILTPSTATDVLRDINFVNKTENRPYSLVFVGVNGVGKSTNLSKVCFWLLQNKKKILVAACDTFRSGAVEQLRVHVRNLTSLCENLNLVGKVELFEKGYGKDSATIARDAISFAKNNEFDVVLVDTAGRMQDNEPLMRALAKLVTMNDPDKIVFVGEALVGNEAVDQLSKFNRALKDFSGLERPRQIDGIILTKFDTVDEKVGAALSMTYVTGKPVLFVGTGQTYTDLKKLNIK